MFLGPRGTAIIMVATALGSSSAAADPLSVQLPCLRIGSSPCILLQCLCILRVLPSFSHSAERLIRLVSCEVLLLGLLV
jgi:hypothetical protein